MSTIKTETRCAEVDVKLLRQQAAQLSAIQWFLTEGETSPDADQWPDALEGVLNLLAWLSR